MISASVIPRIETCAAQKHLALAGHDPLQHPLDVVEPFRRLLPRLGGEHCVRHEEHGDLRLWIVLCERMGQSQAVVTRSVP